jgi:site-specific DNA-methyltransferase (adenine-specific)
VVKKRAPRNKTLTITDEERLFYKSKIFYAKHDFVLEDIINKTICADLFYILGKLPPACIDLLIIDPPYNLNKNFHGVKFSKSNDDSYFNYLQSWFPELLKVLKANASVYLCGDWKNTFCLYKIMKESIIIRNRITWQREKGRGAKKNWKNTTEDIWFGTMGKNYYFDVESVKQKRKVIATYKQNGQTKDWEKTENGNFRLTHPSNFWDDISIPYWSMPENTDHPTQKPEKLIAKLILSSCPKNGLILDPFLGSGTSSVVAKKLGRKFIGIEINEEYCIWTEKRLAQAEEDSTIQGYSDGIFWERNTLNLQISEKNKKTKKNTV